MPQFISDLALILAIAGIVTIIFKRLGQPVVLGYIVAGFLCGPHMDWLPTVADHESVEAWSDIGVVFLMFTLGLEFSLKKVLKMGNGSFITAFAIIFCMIGLGAFVGGLFGWSNINSLFLGGMLAMSSTTIIFKALDDMGLRQSKMAGAVLGVLVVEDILGILLMVILAMVAAAGTLQGGELAMSSLRLISVLVVWFLVGVFVVPTFLRRNRKQLSRETLLIVAVGLCFLMVVLAVKMGYSAAFGAFMMGSILAETVEAEQIEAVVAPVKDLFGAIFFVSVGMLVEPAILTSYAVPILVLVVTILLGQALFGTLGFLFGGQSLRVAMQCGFSMAQIGEFAFIIASLGVSLKVTDPFLYPVVVAVSVITTFLTPYMIKASQPAYAFVERRLPERLRARLLTEGTVSDVIETPWSTLLKALMWQVITYAFLSAAVVAIMLSSVLPIACHIFGRWPGSIVCGVLVIAALAPFLRAIVMRKNHNDNFRLLWRQGGINRMWLLLTILVRFVLSAAFIFYVLQFLSPLATWIHAVASVGLLLVIIGLQPVKTMSIRLEHKFLDNLNSRQRHAERHGHAAPTYAQSLLSHDVHLAIVSLPMNTRLAGQTLGQLGLSQRYGVTVAAIVREGQRINIPGPTQTLFPGDRLQVIGDDDRLKAFADRLLAEVHTDFEASDSEHDVILRRLTVSETSPLAGQTVRTSGIRAVHHCMLVGFEDADEHLTAPQPERTILVGDILWLVGEKSHLNHLPC